MDTCRGHGPRRRCAAGEGLAPDRAARRRAGHDRGREGHRQAPDRQGEAAAADGHPRATPGRRGVLRERSEEAEATATAGLGHGDAFQEHEPRHGTALGWGSWGKEPRREVRYPWWSG